MKQESAKLFSTMKANNVQNERDRDEEIEKLIKESRINLEKQYSGYHVVCDQKVEQMKNESVQYKKNVMEEAKQQMETNKKNFETSKKLMRSRYEEEIQKIKKMFEGKTIKLKQNIQSLHGKIASEKRKHEQNVIEHVNVCKKEFAEKIQMKEAQIKERIKVIEMRYDLKMKETVRANEEKIKVQQTQFKLQQNLMQEEIDEMSKKFKAEIQILKRFRPHSIVHVPISGQNVENASTA